MFLYLSKVAVQKLDWRNSQIDKYYKKYPNSNKNSTDDYNYITNSNRKHESRLEVRKRIFLNANLDFNKYKDTEKAKAKDPYLDPLKLFISSNYQKNATPKIQKSLPSLAHRKKEIFRGSDKKEDKTNPNINILGKTNENQYKSPLPKKVKEQNILFNKIFSTKANSSPKNEYKSQLFKSLSPSNISNNSLNDNNLIEYISSGVGGINSYTSLEKSQNIDDSIGDNSHSNNRLTLLNLKYSNLKIKLYNNSSTNFDNSKSSFIIKSISSSYMNTIPHKDHNRYANKDYQNLKILRNENYTSMSAIPVNDISTKIGSTIDVFKIGRLETSPKIK